MCGNSQILYIPGCLCLLFKTLSASWLTILYLILHVMHTVQTSLEKWLKGHSNSLFTHNIIYCTLHWSLMPPYDLQYSFHLWLWDWFGHPCSDYMFFLNFQSKAQILQGTEFSKKNVKSAGTNTVAKKRTLTCPYLLWDPSTGMFTNGSQLWFLVALQPASHCVCLSHTALWEWSRSLLRPVASTRREHWYN